MTRVKTDNHDPTAKLDLRRHFLRKYHADPPHVLDCCQGSGLLWRTLREEFPIASYWGLDVKPKKGRLALDSRRVLAQPGWPQNVVDIDTYGSPWEHWVNMLPNVTRPTTAFLTVGQVQISGSPLQKAVRSALGIGALRVPNAIGAKLNKMAVSWLLATSWDHGIILTEAIEAESTGNARYIGVHLEPQKTAAVSSDKPTRPKHARAAKEPEHV